jgi:hypothetical protein
MNVFYRNIPKPYTRQRPETPEYLVKKNYTKRNLFITKICIYSLTITPFVKILKRIKMDQSKSEKIIWYDITMPSVINSGCPYGNYSSNEGKQTQTHTQITINHRNNLNYTPQNGKKGKFCIVW